MRKCVLVDELAWIAKVEAEDAIEESSTVTTLEKVLSDRESGDTMEY